MSSAARKQAPRLARPAARYWKGKAPKGVADAPRSDSEDSEDDDAAARPPPGAGDVSISGEQAFDEDEEDEGLQRAGTLGRRGMNVALRDVNISRDGKVIVAGREESGRTAVEEEELEEEESDEETKPRLPGQRADSDEESSEYESESEEEEKPKLQFRPVFVPKRARVTVAEKDAMAQDTEEAQRRKEAEAEERKKQSHDMVADSIRRELAEKEKEDEAPDVDDTDGLDPTAEFEAWRLRELARIKREKEEAAAREDERAEVERRRALPEEQRLREDLARAEQTRADKPKGQQKFLQKYWHKGAFHQDEEILKRHDFTEATSSTVDVSLLPKVMQVKNFGKRSRTKYTHLLDQDTTAGNGGFGGSGAVKAGGTSTQGGGCFVCGGPHMKKDCPQNQDLPPGQRPVTGANGVGGGARQWGGSDARRDERPWKERDDGPRPPERPPPRGDGRERAWRKGGEDDWDVRRGVERDSRDGGNDSGLDRRGGEERRWRSYSRERERSPPQRERWRDEPRRSRSRSLGRSRGDEKRRRLD